MMKSQVGHKAVYFDSYSLKARSASGTFESCGGISILCVWSDKTMESLREADENGNYVNGETKVKFDRVNYPADPDLPWIRKHLDIKTFKEMGCPLELSVDVTTIMTSNPSKDSGEER